MSPEWFLAYQTPFDGQGQSRLRHLMDIAILTGKQSQTMSL
jgi:hypothetical protein